MERTLMLLCRECVKQCACSTRASIHAAWHYAPCQNPLLPLQTKSTPMGVGGRGRAVAARAKAKAGGGK